MIRRCSLGVGLRAGLRPTPAGGDDPEGSSRRWRAARGACDRRLDPETVVASAALALIVGAAFAILVQAVVEQRDSAALATRAQEAIGAADRLERLLLDLETGQRGYLVAREPRFLEPWQVARADYRRAGDELVAASGGQVEPARRIVRVDRCLRP